MQCCYGLRLLPLSAQSTGSILTNDALADRYGPCHSPKSLDKKISNPGFFGCFSLNSRNVQNFPSKRICLNIQIQDFVNFWQRKDPKCSYLSVKRKFFLIFTSRKAGQVLSSSKYKTRLEKN